MDRLLDPNTSLGDWAWWLLSGLVSWRPGWSPSFALLGLLLLGVVMLRLGGNKARRKSDDVDLPAFGRHWFGGVLARHERRVTIDRAHFDIAWRHVGLLGTSGSRKSTLMAMLLEQIGKRYVCLTGDHSPPLLNLTYARGGIVWTPRGAVAWYPWGGPLELAVQRVEHMFPATSSDAGVHRSMFKQAARKAWADVDERARDVRQVIAVLPDIATGASGKMMVENWGARLQELVDSLGGSLRPASDGGFDLVDELRAGRDVMFALNSFADVSNRERFARIAILEVLRASDQAGNLTAAIDEVGLLGAELFAESVRTLRVRLCTGLFASHIAKDFPDVLKGLITVWFLGQLPEESDAKWASSKTHHRVPWEHFGEHKLRLGHFWLVAGGRVQPVSVPTWRTRAVPDVHEILALPWPLEPVSPEIEDLGGIQAVTGCKDGLYGEQVDEGVPAWLPIEDEQLVRIWRHHERVGDHELSKYRRNNVGRPQGSYRNRLWITAALMLAVYEGRDLAEVQRRMGDASAQGLSVDHLCRTLDPTLSAEDEKRCQRVEHLRFITKGGNTAVAWKRRRLQVVAG